MTASGNVKFQSTAHVVGSIVAGGTFTSTDGLTVAAIKAKGLTNLCVPREIRTVREIPKLGTGKVNHRELQKMLEEK